MKLNWFSPLPPAKSGIAVDFFRAILPALSSSADVTLWTDQSEWSKSLEDFVRVRTFNVNHMPWADLNRAGLTVFNLGNNHLFHGTIWEVSRRLPGLTILHDLRLDDFFLNWRPMEMPSQGTRVSRAEEGTTDLTFALENSLGVVVHTSEAFERVNALNRWIVAHIPLAFSLPPATTARRSERAPTAPYRLIVFGFIHRNRRLPSLLQALATLPERDKFQLEIYGELWDLALIERAIADYGLKRNVKIKGFVSEELLDTALSAADLAINLRYPSLGEASISQLRIWAHELPSIVTRAGWFAELPETTVLHVSPENEVADIQKHLRTFLADPAQFQQIGREGKRFLYPKHAPESYVEALLNLGRQVIEFRSRNAAHYLARATGERLSPWISSISSDEPLRRVAEEILVLTR